jgi:hypothetical protein
VVGVDRVTLRIELKRIAPIPVVDPDDVVDEFLARLAPALRLLGVLGFGSVTIAGSRDTHGNAAKLFESGPERETR